MKALLEFVVGYLQVLYLNPAYRFTDSSSRGIADIDASITLSSESLRWDITNDRGLVEMILTPLRYPSEENHFWLSLLRQYLEGGDDSTQGSAVELAAWLTVNLARIEQLFTDPANAPRVCEELVQLRLANARKNWGWPPQSAQNSDS
ncbi:hypothetical protein AB0876_08730 [Mycobacterium sp. NPDC049093]